MTQDGALARIGRTMGSNPVIPLLILLAVPVWVFLRRESGTGSDPD